MTDLSRYYAMRRTRTPQGRRGKLIVERLPDGDAVEKWVLTNLAKSCWLHVEDTTVKFPGGSK